MTEVMYEPFDEDRVRLILLEEVYYLTRAADGARTELATVT